MWHHGKGKKLENHDRLRKAYSRKILLMKRKRLTERAVSEFAQAFRLFIMKRLHIKEQLTYEELKKELMKRRMRNAVRKQILEILKAINNIEYKNAKIEHKGFVRLIEDADKVIKKL